MVTLRVARPLDKTVGLLPGPTSGRRLSATNQATHLATIGRHPASSAEELAATSATEAATPTRGTHSELATSEAEAVVAGVHLEASPNEETSLAATEVAERVAGATGDSHLSS